MYLFIHSFIYMKCSDIANNNYKATSCIIHLTKLRI